MSKTRRFSWMKLFLVLSLGANLLVAGIVFGAVSGRGDTRKAVSMDRERSQISLVAVMPREHRDAVRAQLEALREGRADQRSQRKSDKAALVLLLSQDVVTEAQITDLLATQRVRRAEGALQFEAVVAGEIVKMSPSTRAEYVRRLERTRRWDGDGDKHRKPHDKSDKDR